MEYVLKNGKRYYKNKNGSLILDNDSQADADRREQKSVTSYRGSMSNLSSSRNTSPSSYSNAIPHSNKSATPWVVLAIGIIVLMLVGAIMYNQTHVSMAERYIGEFMEEKRAETQQIETDIENTELENK
ncbi:MAG: hypothetical protein R3Y24_05325 [Eubacteriales bacterium]